MPGKRFELSEQPLSLVEEIGRHMPSGFFVYREDQPKDILSKGQCHRPIRRVRTEYAREARLGDTVELMSA